MEGEDEREPKLYVDVNVANFGLQRIIVYEGDTVESLVSDFVKRCPIDEFMIEKLKTLLQQQIDGVLERIDEDEDLSELDENHS
jgi:type IV secretory pathway ATPase VirB11/archaellum biosynthesis ATPase